MEKRFMEAMQFRHATKEFDSEKKISDEDFNTILEYGILSPSSFGFEPWRFVIVQDTALREKMKEFTWGAQGTLLTASHFVIILARKENSMRYDKQYIKDMLAYKELPQDVQEMYLQFYEKFQKEDFNLLENQRALFDWASKQTYIAMANMMTGAAAMGIDSCPTEGFDIKLANEFIAKELKIDTNEYGVSVMVPFGYRKNEPRGKSRQSIDSVTQWH